MNPDPLAEFRRLVSHRARQCSKQWEDSKKLIEGTILPSTLTQLHRILLDKDLPASVKEPLLRLFDRKTASRVQDLDGECLKSLTGFPPAKALRALSVFFELVPIPGSRWPMTKLTSEELERLVRNIENPFDLLRCADVASVLDIGAGDLSFAEEMVGLYGADLMQQNRELILHCLDRLDPRSQLGGPLHARPNRLQTLQETPGLSFAFFGNQDMFELEQLDVQGLLAPRYTIATCWAPATPTFAYEPTRLSRSLIDRELIRTKGAFRQTRFEREQALEVAHGDRLLLFPPWKFEIVGPLALLNLLARRGAVCVLGSVDDQVFWELLAQVLDESRYRPQEEPFNPVTVPKIFGDLYEALAGLPVGKAIDLSSFATLRRQYPPSGDGFAGAFRYIRIQRGATFADSPASSTARKFSSMSEEVPPWMVTLIPA
ncbi:MAG: hypothetical protein OEY77_12295 [Nitrospira sp.]|nr:hypothetical protein [Nitrospira sp.]